MKLLAYTHGELWLRLRDFDDLRDFKQGAHTERTEDIERVMTHYKLKLQAVWGLLGHYDRDENFDAVEAFTLHCELNGRANTLREDIAC